MKKVLAFALSILMATSFITGCQTKDATSTGGQASGTKNESLVTVSIYQRGSKPKDYDLVNGKINKKLNADGTGIQIERVYIPNDAWDQKINLMLSSGNEFDIFPVMADKTPFSSYYSMGGLADLTEAINKYGPNIKKYIPTEMMSAATVGGKIYTIPTFWITGASDGEFDIRNDLLEENKLSMPTNPDELLTTMKTVQQNWKGTKKLYMMFTPSYDPTSIHTAVLHRTYDTWPFIVKDGFFYIDQQGNVKSWFETPEFKKDCEFMRKAFKMGLINPDILTYKTDQFTNDVAAGNWFISFGTTGTVSDLKKVNPKANADSVSATFFNEEKPSVIGLAFKNSMSISSTSKHVNESIKFFNWLYDNQDNFDLYFYGIEGKHYTKTGEKGITKINDPNNNNQPAYSASQATGGSNLQYQRLSTNEFNANNKVLYTVDKNAKYNVAAGFTFDGSKVQTQYANIKSTANEVLTPLVMGVQDYDKAYPTAIAKMKAAGLDQVLAEYEKQLKNYLASNK